MKMNLTTDESNEGSKKLNEFLKSATFEVVDPIVCASISTEIEISKMTENTKHQGGYFYKLPVKIEAYQWFKNGDHPDDYRFDRVMILNGLPQVLTGRMAARHGYEGHIVRRYRTPDGDGQRECPYCSKIMHEHGWIDTLEGGHIVCPGDWIIKGVHGEYYPCKPDIFEKTYRPAKGLNLSPDNQELALEYLRNLLSMYDCDMYVVASWSQTFEDVRRFLSDFESSDE